MAIALAVAAAATFLIALFHDASVPDTRAGVFPKTPANDARTVRMQTLDTAFPRQPFSDFTEKHTHARELYNSPATPLSPRFSLPELPFTSSSDPATAATAAPPRTSATHDDVVALLAHAAQSGLWHALDDILQAPPSSQLHLEAPDLFPVLNQINTALLLEIKARDETLRGLHDEALRTAVTIVDFSKKLSASGGTVTSWLAAMSIHGIGLRATAAAAVGIAAGAPTPPALREALAHVTVSRFDARETENFIHGEAAWMLGLIEILPRRSWFDLLTYKPNLTKNRYLARMTRAAALAGCDEVALAAADIDCGVEPPDRRWLASHNPFNMAGREFLQISQIEFKEIFRRDMTLRSGTSCVETLLAIQLYRAAHDGTLPPSLDALVPALLLALPTDARNHVPIRYSVPDHVVWFPVKAWWLPGAPESALPFPRHADEDPDVQTTWNEYENVFFLVPP
ncbi:MAG: hypothetical protein LBK99_21125 [Opitutaceae bacterium]|nr:hypothetical protein [Opitutaceae bacterium]